MLRTRRRRLLAVTALFAAVAGWCWWASRPAPLTAEERQYAGWWTYPPVPTSPRTGDQWDTTTVEYRADRTVRWRRVNAKTGQVRYVSPNDVPYDRRRWRVADGHLILSFPRPNRDIVRELPRADFRIRHEYIYEVIWDGPDRYTEERINLPGGRGWWPITTLSRCDPPADAP